MMRRPPRSTRTATHGPHTTLFLSAASLSRLVRSSLLLRPDRIPIGEVRGAEALVLLKAWGTGHPGGVGTIHAGTAIGALRRMEQLIQEAVVTVPRALMAETIDLVAVLSGRGASRRLAELARIEGPGPGGDYRLHPRRNDAAVRRHQESHRRSARRAAVGPDIRRTEQRRHGEELSRMWKYRLCAYITTKKKKNI